MFTNFPDDLIDPLDWRLPRLMEVEQITTIWPHKETPDPKDDDPLDELLRRESGPGE